MFAYCVAAVCIRIYSAVSSKSHSHITYEYENEVYVTGREMNLTIGQNIVISRVHFSMYLNVVFDVQLH